MPSPLTFEESRHVSAERVIRPSMNGSAARTVLDQLAGTTDERGLSVMSERLHELQRFVEEEVLPLREQLDAWVRQGELSRRDGPSSELTQIHRSAFHMLQIPGKYVRPTCVALASAVSPRGTKGGMQELAMAAELVHSATLLHDDVVDQGTTRRGHPAARMVYGNAASVFAGDWLLIRALKLVDQSVGLGADPSVRTRLLDVIEDMIGAEAIQLEHRGRFSMSVDEYFQVVRGKTASLFSWACFAGGVAGGSDERECEHLARFGTELGIAFQLTDDCLDYEGDVATLGKSALSDVREGKATLPLLMALAQDEEDARGWLEKLRGLAFEGEEEAARPVGREDKHEGVRGGVAVPSERTEQASDEAKPGKHVQDERSESTLLSLAQWVIKHKGAEACRAYAAAHAREAVAALSGLPEGGAKRCMESMALALVHRER